MFCFSVRILSRGFFPVKSPQSWGAFLIVTFGVMYQA